MRTILFLYFSIALAQPILSQECLSKYFPENIGDTKVIFVTPSWTEENQHLQEFLEKSNLPSGHYVNNGAIDRYRNRTIKKAKRISKNIFALSEKEYETIKVSLLDFAVFVVRELDVFIKALPEKKTYLSKICYQFYNFKTKSMLDAICFDELSKCLKGRTRGINFRDYVLAKCR